MQELLAQLSHKKFASRKELASIKDLVRSWGSTAPQALGWSYMLHRQGMLWNEPQT